MEAIRNIHGALKDHDVKLYALTTCGWCKKTKKLLEELDVEYLCINFDLLSDEEKKSLRDELKEFNPSISFPTIIIDHGEEVIVGFKEDRIRDVLSHED